METAAWGVTTPNTIKIAGKNFVKEQPGKDGKE